MIYLEHTPAAPLNRFVRTLWYARAPGIRRGRERMLPSGCVQVILNLARDFLLDCPEGESDRRRPPSLVVGARSVYEIVDNSDMEDLIGAVFHPAGFLPFACDAVDLFSNRTVSLEDVWGPAAGGLRDRLRETPDAHARIRVLESFLMERIAAHPDWPGQGRLSMVDFALSRFALNPGIVTVREVARSTGWSERRFSQVFREQVGLSPKLWCRVQRFQRAVRQLHAGGEMPWSELALDCGFYDQSHFANEFRAFSGIDASTYCCLRTEWVNHVPEG